MSLYSNDIVEQKAVINREHFLLSKKCSVFSIHVLLIFYNQYVVIPSLTKKINTEPRLKLISNN